MTRMIFAALSTCCVLSACAAPSDTYIAGRADNDMLRFSAATYAPSLAQPH
jgi:hypothetical protein